MNRISKAGDGARVGATAAVSDDIHDRCIPPAPGLDVTSSQGTILDEEIIAWTSVDDRLPDDDVTVLVCAPGADEPVDV